MRWLFPAALLALLVALGLMLGEVPVALHDILQGLTGGEGAGALTVRILRAPRVLVAVGAGACLGISGAIFQILLRNPLASPDLMGFAPGAGLAMIAALAFGLHLPPPVIAAAGGLAAAVAVAALAWRRGEGLAPLRLVLVGLGVGFTCAALAAFLMLRLPGPDATEAQRWLSGSLAARGWDHVWQVWIAGCALALALAFQVRGLALLELGDDLAQGLGLRLGRARAGLAATGVALMAAGVAVAGPVAFVPLMSGPVGAALTGASRPAPRLVAAGLAGAIITCGADLAARVVAPDFGLPLGVLTGMLGAPYLMWRLTREIERGEL
ncbi:MAG: iron ABC transporter permease [Paracoccaceae bacterium]